LTRGARGHAAPQFRRRNATYLLRGEGREQHYFTRLSGADGASYYVVPHGGPCGGQPASTVSSLAAKLLKKGPKRSQLTARWKSEEGASSQAPECLLHIYKVNHFHEEKF
jgi:hypothetical protein